MDEATARGTGAIDPFWVQTPSEISVFMTPSHAIAYQRWLRSQNLYLFKIPHSDEDEPYYGVGIRWMDGDDRRGPERTEDQPAP